MPTTGGATSNSTCVSPRTSGPTTHRRRVVDLTTEADKATDSVSTGGASERSETSGDDDGEYDSGGDGGCHHNNYPVIRYLLPESLVWGIEDLVLGFYKFMNSLKLGKNMGRKIIGVLMIMVVFSMFFKFSSMVGNHYKEDENGGKNGRRLNGLFVLHTWANVNHNSAVLSETEEPSSSSSSGDSMPKRVLEKFPVSFWFYLFWYKKIEIKVLIFISFLGFWDWFWENKNRIFLVDFW